MPFSVDNMTSAPLQLPKLCHVVCLAGHLGSVDVSFAAKSLLTNLTVDAILVLVFIPEKSRKIFDNHFFTNCIIENSFLCRLMMIL